MGIEDTPGFFILGCILLIYLIRFLRKLWIGDKDLVKWVLGIKKQAN